MFSSMEISVPTLGVSGRGGTRRSIIIIAVSTVGLSLLTTWMALFWHAYGVRHEIAHHGLATAMTAANAVEREVQGMGYLLKGLSRSPLLQTGDLEGFYRQLQATPRPDGAWFTLWDRDRVLLRTRDPFGATLPRINELPGIRDRLEVVRTEGLSMSDRMPSPVTGHWIVSVSLRLDDANGEMNRVLSLLVPEEHLNQAVQDAVRPTEWETVLLDRKLQRLVTGAASPIATSSPPLAWLVSRRNRQLETIEGHLATFERSPKTGYTAVSVLPAAVSNAPILGALYQSSLASLALLLVGGAAVRALLRNVGPVDSLRLTASATQTELLAANQRLAELLESMSDCHITIDRSYRITFINAATLRWCGRPRDEIVGRSYLDLIGRKGDCVAAAVQAVEHRNPFHGEIRSGLRPDRVIDLRVFPSPEGASVYFSDITDRFLAHRATVEERELLQASLDALTKQIAILDGNGRILAVNQAWRRFVDGTGTGVPAHGIGARYLDIAVPDERRFSAMEDVIAGIRPNFQALYQTPSPEGDRWFTIRARRFRIGDKARIVVSHEDITELSAARAAVSELSERLLTLQDEERQRIASELHDSTTQYLVAVGLNLMKIERLLPQRDGQRLLGEIDCLLEEALKELRLFTYLLHPASLEESGFPEAIQAFADGFSDRTGLEVTCRIDRGADELRVEVRRALFRIVQEALSNVHRHAGATRVVVDLRTPPGEVVLCVADDGHGMQAKPTAPETARPTLGVGIPGMRIRLHQFGGTLRIRTGRTGTVIRARVPHDLDNLASHDH
ncbi:sensor histidine kinase [Microvirga lotononidis]|uniref:PAS domain-containing protein,histidine kinase n=1 Tax=Microvirga lotononidis TaxID=864069 RepID=I4Z1Z7_9HYPH|nr:PAS domain-containing protein [Microvirga lotononidis]EIM30239.1 PAS domain-containing protein,histidine kinase [Microvirga lotononidis]WQO31543.1 PAS domain-containing protein [Microvirga lotononidis]